MRRFSHWGSKFFAGTDSIKDYQHPNRTPYSLVQLPDQLNKFAKNNVDIFAHCVYENPCTNIKLFSAWNMLQTAHRDGKLEGIKTLVASSSGNFIYSLKMIARRFGIDNVRAIVPGDLAPGRLEALRLSGVKLDLVGSGAIQAAIDYEQNNKSVLHLNQYADPANPEGFEKYYAPGLAEQINGYMTIFCAGLGTGGTAIGVKRYFKDRQNLIVVGVHLAKENAVPGLRTVKRLEEVSQPLSELDVRTEATAQESYKWSLLLHRYTGLIAGPSSGTALAGLLRFLQKAADAGFLDKFRNDAGRVVAVFPCPDQLTAYTDKYTTYLGPECFDPAFTDSLL